MLENILLDIFLPLLNAGEYFVVCFLAIGESWRIFCWLLSCHQLMLEYILLNIVLPLENAGEYFVVYCLAINESWRIFCWVFLAINE